MKYELLYLPMFTLPKLPYAYHALEPYIDAATMEVHHTKHHQGYVNKLNEALQHLNHSVPSLEALLANSQYYGPAVTHHAGGHWNHTMFWQNLAPAGGGGPKGRLSKALAQYFGSTEAFIESFTKKALARFGSGWAWLCVDTKGGLHICTTPNQDNPLMYQDTAAWTPILGLDVWEHAYYLKYQNKRDAYITAFWKVVNWEVVNERLGKALTHEL